MMIWALAAYLVYALMCGLFAGRIALSKGRGALDWFLAGLFFGLIGLLAAGLIEPVSVEESEIGRKEPVDGPAGPIRS